MSSDFIALDVETANPDFASICQVGIAVVVDGQIDHQWQSFVNPQDYFDDWHVERHGITANSVAASPTFPQIYKHLASVLKDRVVATHTPFDQAALLRVTQKYQLPIFDCTWIDTARVARRAWPQFSQRGYNLANLANEFNISFQHHRADEDARAAALILLKAMAEHEMTLD